MLPTKTVNACAPRFCWQFPRENWPQMDLSLSTMEEGSGREGWSWEQAPGAGAGHGYSRLLGLYRYPKLLTAVVGGKRKKRKESPRSPDISISNTKRLLKLPPLIAL